MVKVKEVFLKELQGKHYTTEVAVVVEHEDGSVYLLGVDVYGYFPRPSQREIDKGWEPDYGVDHVESEAEYKVALAIVEALKGRILA